ncbi:MAG: hypothetical protein JJ974_00140 [Phycisphaerales bacterium]|nr:hypothetical protein [Phycisphaerales bacterium]
MWNTKILIITLTVLVLIEGCAPIGQSIDQLSRIRDQASAIESDLDTQLDELTLMRESIPDGSDQADALDALIAQINAKLAVVQTSILHADQVIESATNPSDPLTIAADAVSPYVPAPIQAPLVLGAALIATMLRSRSLTQGTRSIVESINHTLKRDENFQAAFSANADTIRTIQTPTARRLVNKWSD